MAKNVKITLTAKDKGSKEVKKFTKTMTSSMRDIGGGGKKANIVFSKMTKQMKLMTAAAVAFAAAAALAFGKSSVKAASDLQEVTSKFETVFRGQMKAANKFSDELQRSYGLSQRAAKEFLSSVQDLLKPMGMAADAATEMSGAIVKLAVDLGSFNNVDTEKVMMDMQSALVGNFETMKKYGVILNETVVKAEAYSSGLVKVGEVLNANQKAQAAYNLIVKGSRDAIKDWARTSGGYANQLKALLYNLEDFRALVGDKILPILTDVISEFNEWADAGNNLQRTVDILTKALKAFYVVFQALAFMAVAAGIGAMVSGVGKLATSFMGLQKAMNVVNTNMGNIQNTFGAINTAAPRHFSVLDTMKIKYRKLGEAANKLSLSMKFAMVTMAAFIGWKIGKAIDSWLNSFEWYRKTMIRIFASVETFIAGFLHFFKGIWITMKKVTATAVLFMHNKITGFLQSIEKAYAMTKTILSGKGLGEAKFESAKVTAKYSKIGIKYSANISELEKAGRLLDEQYAKDKRFRAQVKKDALIAIKTETTHGGFLSEADERADKERKKKAAADRKDLAEKRAAAAIAAEKVIADAKKEAEKLTKLLEEQKRLQVEADIEYNHKENLAEIAANVATIKREKSNVKYLKELRKNQFEDRLESARELTRKVAEYDQAQRDAEEVARDKAIEDEAKAQKKALVEMRKVMKEKQRMWDRIADSISSTMASSLTDIAMGARTAKEAFADMARSIGRYILEMTVKMIAFKAVSGIFSAVFGGAGGGTTLGSTATAPSGMIANTALGGVFQNGVKTFAGGGIVNRPTLFPMAKGAGLMGEAGPEAILPLVRRGGKLGVAGGGGSNITVINNIENKAAATPEQNQDLANKLSRVFKEDIRKIMIDEKRMNGINSTRTTGRSF